MYFKSMYALHRESSAPLILHRFYSSKGALAGSGSYKQPKTVLSFSESRIFSPQLWVIWMVEMVSRMLHQGQCGTPPAAMVGLCAAVPVAHAKRLPRQYITFLKSTCFKPSLLSILKSPTIQITPPFTLTLTQFLADAARHLHH